jgi:hypothetical protein
MIAAVILALAITGLVYLCRSKSRQRGFGQQPPGPAGWPIFGVTFDLFDPNCRPEAKFAQWNQQYAGPSGLMRIATLRREHIVLRCVQSVVLLL